MYSRRPFVLVQGVVSNPSSASYLDFDWSGNKTEKRFSKKHSNPSGSNPSGVLKKLARPDMLIFAGGATCLVNALLQQGSSCMLSHKSTCYCRACEAPAAHSWPKPSLPDTHYTMIHQTGAAGTAPSCVARAQLTVVQQLPSCRLALQSQKQQHQSLQVPIQP